MTETPSIRAIDLTDFRCFDSFAAEFGPGLTVLLGDNGEGKSSLLEAIAWSCRGRSFRRVADATLIRAAQTSAVIRTEIDVDDRRHIIAAELRTAGRTRILLDGQPVTRRSDLGDVASVTVFTPDDLELVKGGPSERRTYLDELLASVSPRYRAALADYDQVLRQRNALLKSMSPGPDDESTRAVFDAQLVASGSEIVRGRLGLLEQLTPRLVDAHTALSGGGLVEARYLAELGGEGAIAVERDEVEAELGAALERCRPRERDRRVTLVGPHRDDWSLTIDGLDARAQSSQGEQRTLALALRLAGHLTVRAVTNRTPVLLFDDVFSELDPHRAAALVERLPSGQTVLTTADTVPAAVEPERVIRLRDHRVESPTS